MWTDGVITDGGRELLARWVSGGTLTIEKATAGTGTVSAVLLAQSTALVEEKQALSIISRKDVDGGVEIKLQMGPGESAGTMNQIGLWGRLDDGEDVLIAIYQDANGINVPAKSEMPDFVYAMYAMVCMSNELELNVTMDSNAYVTMDTLEEALKDLGFEVDQEVLEGSENAVSGGAVKRYVDSGISDVRKTANGAVKRSGDTMRGALIADEISMANLTLAQVRNVISVDVDPGEGTTSSYPAGTIVLVRKGGAGA